MRTVQGVALDGLKARVRALAERTGLPVRSAPFAARAAGAGAARRSTGRAGRPPRGGTPLADRGPAGKGLGAETAGRRTFVRESFRHPAASSSGPAAVPAVPGVLRGLLSALAPARPLRRPGEVRASAAALRALRARHG
ncbi:hypothetical protein ACFVFI_38445, partial [Streptomyces sp. NPDC057705]|uniref:hypothetical protein n=1 Tax=Streptomyces sp. NPDC057705 TaxID=3346222 RepID=UPI0036BDF523